SIGNLTVTGSMTNTGVATFGGTQLWSAGSTFINAGGTSVFQSDAGSASSAPLTVSISGGTVSFSAAQHLLSLGVSGTTSLARATSSSSATAPLVFNIINLAISNGGQFDLTNNELLTQSTLATTRGQLLATQLLTSNSNGSLGYVDKGGGTIEVRFTL